MIQIEHSLDTSFTRYIHLHACNKSHYSGFCILTEYFFINLGATGIIIKHISIASVKIVIEDSRFISS